MLSLSSSKGIYGQCDFVVIHVQREMQTFQTLFLRITKKEPFLFPVIVIFHSAVLDLAYVLICCDNILYVNSHEFKVKPRSVSPGSIFFLNNLET